jgi:cobalamin-dependent methionine synthase I
MLLVGELINASRRAVGEAINSGNSSYIARLAKVQHEAGADYIDVNAALSVKEEPERLVWLVELVQARIRAPCCIDSPNPEAIEGALTAHDNSNGPAMINSISLERDRYEFFLPVIRGADVKVVALCMSDAGIPQTAEQRLAIAGELINGLVRVGITIDNIYVDPLVQPAATGSHNGLEFLDSVERIMAEFPGVHTICGLSNISYGLPRRKFMNQTLMTMAIARGLDAALIDPLDKRMMANIVCSESLAGRDEFCQKYLQAFRTGGFDFQ